MAVHELPLRKAALASFFAMCIQDCIGTAMVVWESRLAIVPSGMCDVFGYLAGLICSVLALDSILRDGWRNKRSLVLIAVVSWANFVGTGLGVMFVARVAHSHASLF